MRLCLLWEIRNVNLQVGARPCVGKNWKERRSLQIHTRQAVTHTRTHDGSGNNWKACRELRVESQWRVAPGACRPQCVHVFALVLKFS